MSVLGVLPWNRSRGAEAHTCITLPYMSWLLKYYVVHQRVQCLTLNLSGNNRMHTTSILDLYKANRHAQRPLVKELPRSRLRVLTFNSNVILTVYVLPILLTTMHTTIYVSLQDLCY